MRNHSPLHLMIGVVALLAVVVQPAFAQTADQATTPGVDKTVPQAPKPATAPAPAVVPTQPPPGTYNPKDWNANVRVDVTFTDINAKGVATQKSIGITVRNDGRASVRSGVSMQVPSTTFVPLAQGGAAASPLTSYQYKDMGLSLDVTSVVISDNFVKLRIAVEYNPVDEKTASQEGAIASPAGQGMASFSQFRQNLDVVLENGKPLVVAMSSDPVPSRDRKTSLEVKATILR